MEPFLVTLTPAKVDLRNLIKSTAQQLRNDQQVGDKSQPSRTCVLTINARSIKLSATTEDFDSYLMKVMRPLYQEAKNYSGE